MPSRPAPRSTAAWLQALRHRGTGDPAGAGAGVLQDREIGPPHGDPYVLCLATNDPRASRSGVMLFEAFAQLGEEICHASSSPDLLRPECGGAGRSSRDRRTGRGARHGSATPSFESLYRGAVAFVHPSLLRGVRQHTSGSGRRWRSERRWLRCGLGCVTEALAGAALLVERADPALLADALRAVVGDAELRSRLVQAGRERVAPLRWERAAGELAAVFRRTLVLAVLAQARRAPSRIATVRSSMVSRR